MGRRRQTDARPAHDALDGLASDPCGCALCAAVVRDARRRRGERGLLPLDLTPGNLAVARCDACGHYVPLDVLEHVHVGDHACAYVLCGLCSPCPTCGRCVPDELATYADHHGTVRTCHRCEPLMPHEVHEVLTARWNRDPDTAPGWHCAGVECDERGGERDVELSAAGERV